MPRTKRNFIQGEFYHVYNRGNRQLPIFFNYHDRNFLSRKINELASPCECNINILIYCLMDNHYHLVIQEGPHTTISKFMQRLLTSYSVYFNTRHGLKGHTFQGRFKAKHIITWSSLIRVMNYIKRNPVEAGYVSDPAHYNWLFFREVPDPSRV